MSEPNEDLATDSAELPSSLAKTLAIDIGGTGIKTIVLDSQGEPMTERNRLQTPRPATPDAVLACIRQLANQQGDFDRVSVGFPAVVRQGIIVSVPHNLDPTWMKFPMAAQLEELLGKPTRVANDADIQGLGVIAGDGVELVLTLGTGLGSALFVEGHLVPNLELAHHPFRKSKTYEENLGKVAMEFLGKKKWSKRVLKAIESLEALFNYDALYLGGGNAKKLKVELPSNVHIVPNVAGLLGGIALWRD